MFNSILQSSRFRLEMKINEINARKNFIKNTCEYAYDRKLSDLYGEADIIVDRILKLYDGSQNTLHG